MSGPFQPPPPIPSKQNSSDQDSTGAQVQIEVLCEYLLREFLNNSAEEVEEVFEAYGENTRDLYDNIDQINKSPETMKNKRSLTRINNIFDEYAGIAPMDREFQPPPGLKVFKSIGIVKPDGTCEPHPTLTPKAKAAPPVSPETMKRMNRFLPGTDPNDARGIIFPTSPHQQEPMKWPLALKPEGFGKGSRGNKIPCPVSDVRIGDGSVLPPHGARSPSYRDVAAASSGSGNSMAKRGLPRVNLPGQAGPGPTGPIKTSGEDIHLDPNRPMDACDNEWPPGRLDEASRRIATYLRHGSQDRRYNIHGPDGYVRVAVFIQLPEMRNVRIDQHVVELVLKSRNPRIMTNASGDRIRAIQGHTLEQFNISELYIKISTHEDFVNHPEWVGRGVPDNLVLEISNENHLDQWRRIGTFPPRLRYRFHTMRAVCGTGEQEFGAKHIVFYASISVEALFEHIAKIDIYVTDYGRIVTKCSIPASLVTKVRRNGDMATEIIDPMQAPPPSAPAGSQRVRSRDSKGGSPAPQGSNYTDLPMPDRKVTTKNMLELKSGHMNMPSRMTKGNPWQQHRQLQMLKGVLKTTMCNHEHKFPHGCSKGDECVFAHSTDNPAKIDAEVTPLRFKVYTKLYEDKFSPPFEILYEICQISKEQYQAILEKRARHQERLDEQAANELAARTQRPRMHDNSRSPRSIPSDRDCITPDPQRRGPPENYNDLTMLSKGKGRGNVSAKMVDDDSSARQRDLTSGGADDDEGSDREEEAVVPIDDDNMGIAPLEEEPRSLSPCDKDIDPEPTPQLAEETGDVDMISGLPTVNA